ncbi:MAG TPA: response regulator transcription factor [Candidatus Acidoferrales bacterium]|jgi:two-component system response regulator NreC
MRILIADDHHLVRRGVGNLLSKEAGWEICGEAADAAQALQKASELNPDLILLDISMPDGSGLDAARRIRQEIPHVKILMMSYHDAAQFEKTARESGADGCIDKARLALDLVDVIKSLQPSSGKFAGSSPT